MQVAAGHAAAGGLGVGRADEHEEFLRGLVRAARVAALAAVSVRRATF